MTTTKEQLEELRAEVIAQAKLLKELEAKLKPPEPFVPMPMPRFDPTEGMSMPRNAMQAMIDAVPASVMADIRGDARRPNPMQASSSPISSSSSSAQSEPQRKGGWVEQRPLEPPPGLKYVDAQLDAQDAKDRAELALKLANAAAIEQATKAGSGGK